MANTVNSSPENSDEELYKRYKKFVEKLYPGDPVDKTPEEFKEWWGKQTPDDRKKMEHDFMDGYEGIIKRSREQRVKNPSRNPGSGGIGH